MIPDLQTIEALHRRYAVNDQVFDLVYTHCLIVNEIAQWCADRIDEPVDRELLQASCLLHDIATYICFNDDGQGNHNEYNYKQHAIFGAALVNEEGFDLQIANNIRTHVLMGLTKEEIVTNGWALPVKDYEPTTIEGRLLCYADRFHSKTPTFTTYDTFLRRLKTKLPLQAAKFETWAEEFGVPDVPALAIKYGHPVR